MKKIYFKIADIVIKVQSKDVMRPMNLTEQGRRIENFVYTGKRKEEIKLNVSLVDKVPCDSKRKKMFTTFSADKSQEKQWSIEKDSNGFVIRSYAKGEEKVFFINKQFTVINAFVKPQIICKSALKSKKEMDILTPPYKFIYDHKGRVWLMEELLSAIFQVCLMNYIVLNKKDGFMLHCAAVKKKNSGFVFAGKSEAGKSTISELFSKSSDYKVINDERVFIRIAKNGKIYFYNLPWTGDFKGTMDSYTKKIMLKKIFFLKKSLKNNCKPVSKLQLYKEIHGFIFLPFGNKKSLENVFNTVAKFASKISCDVFSFRKDASAIDFFDQSMYF